MKIEDLKKGIDILMANGAIGYGVESGHDQICLYDARKIKLRLSEIRKLYKLGFIIDDENWIVYT